MPDNPFLQPATPATSQFTMAEITETDPDVKIKIAAEDSAREKAYKRLSSYAPAVGDRVLIASISGTYVILGKVV